MECLPSKCKSLEFKSQYHHHHHNKKKADKRRKMVAGWDVGKFERGHSDIGCKGY
jgi:hypothetical protein